MSGTIIAIGAGIAVLGSFGASAVRVNLVKGEWYWYSNW
jgi:hypothetical protein